MANKMEVDILAPDFELVDTHGRTISLSNFRGNQPVVLVMTRGFI
jgi:peroxiredoxin